MIVYFSFFYKSKQISIKISSWKWLWYSAITDKWKQWKKIAI